MEELKNSLTSGPELEPPMPRRSPRFSRKKIIIASVAVVVFAAATFFILFTKNDSKDSSNTPKTSTSQSSKTPTQNLFLQQYGNNCKQQDVAFTSAPMRLEDLAYIRPLGAVNDGHVTPTDHVYIGGPNPSAPDNTYPVLMPADGTVTAVGAMPAQYVGDRQGQQVASEDHRIVISHSCRYFSIYIHIHKLGDKVAAQVGSLKPNENKQTAIALKAGEIVGYIGGSTFDWTPIDTTKTLKGFITPSLYDGESWKIHTVSPFDLYAGDLKSKLEAKSLRSVAPLGGKIDYDQQGKLIGNWFRQGSGGYSGQGGNNGGRYWDGHLSVVPDYIDPLSTIVSIGNWTGNAAQFVVSGSRDPSKVSAKEGAVKYELKRISYVSSNGQAGAGNMYTKGMRPTQDNPVEGTIMFQVLAGEKLKVEKFPGKTASQVTGFTPAAQTYDR